MKKITSILLVLLIGSATANTNINARFNQNEPIQFCERGIDFFVFLDGTFDFNTRPDNNNSDYYFRNKSTRFGALNNSCDNNFGVRIEQDHFGRIRRVGNIFINYDAQNRVARIGSIFLRYNRFALLQVGGLQLVYNRFGNIVNTFGAVRNTRSFGYTHSVPTYSYGGNNHFDNSDYYNDYEDTSNNNSGYYYRNNGSKMPLDSTSQNVEPTYRIGRKN